jgi:hypothetical protein
MGLSTDELDAKIKALNNEAKLNDVLSTIDDGEAFAFTVYKIHGLFIGYLNSDDVVTITSAPIQYAESIINKNVIHLEDINQIFKIEGIKDAE